jgi:hexosaminidase
MSKLCNTLAGAFMLLLSVSTMQLQAINIIPQPSEVKTLSGTFTLSGATAIIPGKSAGEANQLQQALQETYGLSLSLVNPGGITITAATNTGIFYGIQSLRQLISANGNSYTINAVSVKDKPRFSWRAFMLD